MVDVDAELEVVKARWASDFEHNEAHFLWANGFHSEVVADAPERLRLLMAAVGLVLLIACANIANLLLARGERRHSEVAVRTTLGAGRGRIPRQLATESLVLAGAAAVLGLALAYVGTHQLIAMDPEALPRLGEVAWDGNVLLFTLGMTLVTAMLFGIAPALLAGRRAASSLAGYASRTVGGPRSRSLRRVLVTGEVGLSLVVILAGLVVRSFSALTDTNPRIDPDNLMTFVISLPSAAYPDDELIPSEFERLMDGLRALTGVTEVTGGSSLPFSGRAQWDFQLEDRPPRPDGDLAWNAGITHVGTDYFETYGIPVLEGRGLTSRDGRHDELVAVVSETMASRFWPGESVIGKRFGYQMEDSMPWMTIVGLVRDRVNSVVNEERYPHVYVPESQAGISTYFVPRSFGIVVRAGPSVEGLVPGMRAAVSDFDSDLPLYQMRTMEDIVSASFAGPRIMTNLLGIFALIALVLAGVGIYGVISYSVAGRTKEIGVRAALGAERGEITRMILGEGARPLVAGVTCGVVGAWLATRLLEQMLWVEATDPLTFVLLAGVLLAVGMAANWVPAMRATRIAPTEALREQ